MVTSGISVSVSYDYGRGAAEIAALSPHLARAWRDATDEATEVIKDSVVDTIVDRTGMGRGMVEEMVEAESHSDGGNTSYGVVGLSKPPARFYPKTAKALSFVIGGRRITVKSVKGSRPYKLVGAGAENAERAVERIYRDAVEGVMNG